MAIVLMEGFDLLTAGYVATKYPLGAQFSATMVAGRFAPGQGYRPGPSNQNGQFTCSFASASAFTVGLGLFFPIAYCGTGFAALRFLTTAGARQCGVGFKDDGSVIIQGGASGTTLLATSAPGVVTDMVWCYLEAEVVISDTVGSIAVYVNGALVVSVSGVDTKGQTASTVERFQVTASGTGIPTSQGFGMDDLYVTDTAARLGESRIYVLEPNSDDSVQWTPSTGSDNFACVDEAPFNTSDWVASATTGHQDFYGFANLPYVPAAIHAVQTSMFAAKDDAATRTVRANLESGATVANGSDFGLSATYLQKTDIYEVDPNTSAAWTASAVDALLAGPEVRP
jgi:hypothetical protein